MSGQMTISFNKANITSLAHNNRENLFGNPDIDLERVKDNIMYVKSDIREMYHEIFDQAVADYNAKQKRSDRKIDDYFSKILHDKKTHHQQELIVAVGCKDENTEEIFEMKKEILDDYMKGFQERNPNLKVYNAVMHLDEANPHLHINFVPVYESKRGLSKRVGFDKAIEQQDGLTFERWRESETGVIERQLKEKGIERRYKGSHSYMKVAEYKEYAKSLETLRSEKNTVKNDLNEIKGELEQVRSEFLVTEKEFKKKDRKVKDLEVKSQILEEGIARGLSFDEKLKQFGFLYQSELKSEEIKKFPVVGEMVKVEKYRELEKKYEIALEQNEKLKMSNAFNPVYQNSLRQDLEKKYESLSQSFNLKNKMNEHLTERVNELQKENKQLRKENVNLKSKYQFLKQEVDEIKTNFHRFRNATCLFLMENKLLKNFKELLVEVDFKLKENLRNNSITDFITQEKLKEQEKIKMPSKVKPQDRGMER